MKTSLQKKNATLCEITHDVGSPTGSVVSIWETVMDAALERRVSVATCWATTRINALDSAERYEDSYALTQEFREWITCIGESPELFAESVLSVGKISKNQKGLDLEEGAEDSVEI
jgi:hypothetical protein